jgi:phosphatidylinositol-3-phosphatase
MNRHLLCIFILGLLAACVPVPAATQPAVSPPSVPDFEHIVLIVFENKGFDTVMDNPLMPNFNLLAQENTLLTSYYAVRHPSLPNYLALLGGHTFGIDSDCTECFIDAPSLPDLIEESGRTWKTYQEEMPEACFHGDEGQYFQKHNPFVYFDPIRLDRIRCEQNVLPLTALEQDIEAGALTNFVFITPNICNDSHSCSLDVADAWLGDLLETLIPPLDGTGEPYLVAILFDEAPKLDFPGRLIEIGGGHIAVILYSPLARNGFEDPTFYNHYSLLKTISAAWGLPYLGHAADNSTQLITLPWK